MPPPKKITPKKNKNSQKKVQNLLITRSTSWRDTYTLIINEALLQRNLLSNYIPSFQHKFAYDNVLIRQLLTFQCFLDNFFQKFSGGAFEFSGGAF